MNNALKKMGFDPNVFHERILQLFPKKKYLFEHLIDELFNEDKLDTDDFNAFSDKYNLDDGLSPYNSLYELFNNIRCFKEDGKFLLFKEREAAWGLPSNVLNREDIGGDIGDLSDLSDSFEIYRGMSNEEFDSGDFGQSWSTDDKIARRFANDTYSDKPKGIVVKTKISKSEVLHYDKNKEFEVILIKGNPKKSDVSIIS